MPSTAVPAASPPRPAPADTLHGPDSVAPLCTLLRQSADTEPSEERPTEPQRTASRPAPVSSRLRRWVDTACRGLGDAAGLTPYTAGEQRLHRAQLAFEAALQGVSSDAMRRPRERIRTARSLQELWELRPQLFDAVARHFTQGEAELRVRTLETHFPRRMRRERDRRPG